MTWNNAPFYYSTSTYSRRTICDECQTPLTLTHVDGDGVLIGDECPECGYYVTRYMPGQEPR